MRLAIAGADLVLLQYFQPRCEPNRFQRLRQPSHIPRPTPESSAPASLLRSVIGTKRVCCAISDPYNTNRNSPHSSPAFARRAERGKGRCPFPRAPIPNPEIVPAFRPSPVEKKPLSTDEDTSFFFGLVKLQPGTFLLWTKRGHFYCGMTVHRTTLDTVFSQS